MPSESAPVATRPAPVPTISGLFIAFAKISLMGFGGVLVWARRSIVEQNRWLTAEQFNEVFALCHFLPGPNTVNLSMVFGSRLRGLAGGIAAFLGLLLPPIVIVTVLGVIYMHFGQIDSLQRALNGVVCVTVGLFLGTVAKMIQPLVQQRSPLAFAVLAAVFVAVGVMRWPLPTVLLTAVPISLALTYWMQRRQR